MHPLPNHPFAQRAAQAALAAQEQGKFMEMHELLLGRFRSFNQLGQAKAAAMGLDPGRGASPQVQDAVFADFAQELGLDEGRFVESYASPKTRSRIVSETREVVAVGASGTPANFVNGRYLRGAAPYQTFQALVDRALGGAERGSLAPNP